MERRFVLIQAQEEPVVTDSNLFVSFRDVVYADDRPPSQSTSPLGFFSSSFVNEIYVVNGTIKDAVPFQSISTQPNERTILPVDWDAFTLETVTLPDGQTWTAKKYTFTTPLSVTGKDALFYGSQSIASYIESLRLTVDWIPSQVFSRNLWIGTRNYMLSPATGFAVVYEYSGGQVIGRAGYYLSPSNLTGPEQSTSISIMNPWGDNSAELEKLWWFRSGVDYVQTGSTYTFDPFDSGAIFIAWYRRFLY